MTDFNVGVMVAPHNNGWRWYLIGDYNDHVLAQGFAKTSNMATKKATHAKTAFLYEMTGELVVDGEV